MSRYWSDIVSKLTPYTPGEQPQIQDLIKLNTNENPYGPSPKVIQAISNVNNEGLRKYPDPTALNLKKTIAEYYSHHNISSDNVFVGNSSDEVLAHVFRGLLKKSKPLLFPDITYSFYPVYCDLFGIDYQTVPLQKDFTINIKDFPANNGGIIFANPNAPTGLGLDIDQLTKLLDTHPNSVIVIDEAYIDFAEGGVRSAVELIDEYDNLLVTQTLSKSRNLAGLRVGLALAHPDLIDGLERVKNSFHPYALDTLALAGAEAAFKDIEYFQECSLKVKTTRKKFTKKLLELGFNVLDSSTNFVFASHKGHNARSLFEGLREKKIIVRYFDKPRLDQFLRISIGTEDEMQACAIALQELTKL